MPLRIYAQLLLHRLGAGDPCAALAEARESLLAQQDESKPREVAAIRLLEAVRLALDRRDGMYLPGQATHYLQVGLSALENVDAALARQQGVGPPATIMDFPTGYGRVTRFLRAGFPSAELFGADIRKGAVAFCEKEFDLQGFESHEDLSRITAPQPVDLIWCGSLLTHIDRAAATSLLRFFYRSLRPGGICLVSAHGQRTLHMLKSGQHHYRLTAAGSKGVLRGYRASGYGFASYPGRGRYGISVTEPECFSRMVSETGDWTLKEFRPRGWDNHQDIYTLERPV